MFQKFPKMARLSREMVVTEKIDGTNAQIYICKSEECSTPEHILAQLDGLVLLAGSRNRFLTPTADNYGFASWVSQNTECLFKLGEGRHFGEWWGKGVQRGYGIEGRKFSLFNVSRWNEETKPECCSVVPTLYTGLFSVEKCDEILRDLQAKGSVAAPGFMNPEGIIAFHVAGNIGFKKTIGNDGAKGAR
jgi:hypothetical protein